jgi:predicted acetyltransferase
MQLTVVPPSNEFKSAFLRMLEDFAAVEPQNAEFYASAKEDFAVYVQSLLDEEHGLNLREGWVPCSHRWLVNESEAVVGATRLRHNISTPFLAENAGHIGYDIAPSHRRLGYGHCALRAALSLARQQGLPRVLLFAAEDNAASRAVIERQGGVLESTSFSAHWGEQLCRYWLTVPPRAEP